VRAEVVEGGAEAGNKGCGCGRMREGECLWAGAAGLEEGGGVCWGAPEATRDTLTAGISQESVLFSFFRC